MILGVDPATTEKILKLSARPEEKLDNPFPLDCIEEGYKETIYDKLPIEYELPIFGTVPIRCKICKCSRGLFDILG